MLRAITIVLIFLCSAGCIDTEQDYVAVVGVGEAKMAPTHAMISVSFTGEGSTSSEATSALNEKISKARKIAEDFSVDEDGINSRYFDISEKTRSVRRPDGSRYSEKDGYQALQNIQITTSNIGTAGALLGALIDIGTDDVSSPIYLIPETDVLFEKARSLAMKDARRRAQLFADEAGVEIASVEIIEESGTEAERLEFQLRDRIVRRYTQEEVGGEVGRSPPAMSIDAMYVSANREVFSKPEDISVTVSIYAKFALE